jgi:hypothetical protein
MPARNRISAAALLGKGDEIVIGSVTMNRSWAARATRAHLVLAVRLQSGRH